MNHRTIAGLVVLSIVLRLIIFWAVGPTTGSTPFYYESVAQSLVQGKGFTYLPYYLVNFPPDIKKTFGNLHRPIEDIGRHLAGDPVFSVREPVYRYPPAYPIFLAANHMVFGPGPTPVVMVQILLNALVVFFIYRMAYLVFQDTRMAAAAGFLAAVWPFTLLNSISYEPTALLYVTVIGSVAAVQEYLFCRRMMYLVAAGLLSGISALLRTDALFATFGLALALLLISPAALWPRLRTAGIYLMLTAAVMSPWLIRNAMVFHRFVPLSCGLGVNLMIGIGRYIPESGFPPHDRRMIEDEMGSDYVRGPMMTDDGCYPDGIEREAARVEKAKSYIREHPWTFLVSCIRRAPDLFFVGADTVSKRFGGSWYGQLAQLVLVCIEPIFFLGAIIGAIRARRLWPRMFPLVLAVILYAIGHLPMWVEPRYFKPVWPILLLLAVAAIPYSSARPSREASTPARG